jgi:HicB_like antitoxin of bacterial toxin-antitoxin system
MERSVIRDSAIQPRRPPRIALRSIRATTLEFRIPERICIGMKIKVVVHEAEEGGFWAEVPAIPGCTTQGETMDELMRNLHEAIAGCLAIS